MKRPVSSDPALKATRSRGSSLESEARKSHLQPDMMLWYNFGHCWLSLAALLVVASCEKGEHRRGTESGGSSSTGGGGGGSGGGGGGGSGTNYSNRRLHRIQHGQCTYTFILPEGEGGRGASCREAKATGAQHNANSLQRDAPPPETDFPSQKIQQLEHIMENYTQWLQKVRTSELQQELWIYVTLCFQVVASQTLHHTGCVLFEATVYLLSGVCGLFVVFFEARTKTRTCLLFCHVGTSHNVFVWVFPCFAC